MQLGAFRRLAAAVVVIALAGCAHRETERFALHENAPGAIAPLTTAVAPDHARVDSSESLAKTLPASKRMEVHFINVGQGECTLVVCPNGKRILVDAGSTTKGFDPAPVRGYIMEHLGSAKRIDAIVVSHPDSDHYNLLPEVLDGVEVGHVYLTDKPSEYRESGVSVWLQEFSSADLTILKATDAKTASPQRLDDFGEAKVLVLASNVEDTTVHSPTNSRSIVLKVSLGAVNVMLTGDATRDTENSIIAHVPSWDLHADVLQVAHHGSNATSTSAEWAQAVQPKVAVVSAGAKNSYGHPSQTVIKRLEPYTMTAKPHDFRWSIRTNGKSQFQDVADYTEAIYTTSVDGNIVVVTDGQTLDVDYGR